MRKILTFFILFVVNVFADWIQPPIITENGYPVPQPGIVPELPRAHGAHPGYGIEWWYWVGHLKSTNGDETFGFQSTVFRIEGAAGALRSGMQPVFGDQQLFMAHAALSDLTAGTYTHAERIFREGWQAQASTARLDLAVGGITARMIEGSELMEKTVALDDGSMLVLTLVPEKPLLAFGERGLSRKGADPVAVSWYWTYPRLRISGELIRAGQVTAVEGIGWLDHEISSSQLGSELDGWDWTAIQLDDGTEVKAYRLRTNEGGADPWSAVYWIDVAGKTEVSYADGFTWNTVSEWESRQTGNRYPTGVRVEARHPRTGEMMVYRLEPMLDAQEFVGNRAENAYWEGACRVLDETGKAIGRAYLELAGYGGNLGGMLTK
ncbi:MAG: lipocalin-like domain-containing protein [Coraliomargarita sp.]